MTVQNLLRVNDFFIWSYTAHWEQSFEPSSGSREEFAIFDPPCSCVSVRERRAAPTQYSCARKPLNRLSPAAGLHATPRP